MVTAIKQQRAREEERKGFEDSLVVAGVRTCMIVLGGPRRDPVGRSLPPGRTSFFAGGWEVILMMFSRFWHHLVISDDTVQQCGPGIMINDEQNSNVSSGKQESREGIWIDFSIYFNRVDPPPDRRRAFTKDPLSLFCSLDRYCMFMKNIWNICMYVRVAGLTTYVPRGNRSDLLLFGHVGGLFASSPRPHVQWTLDNNNNNNNDIKIILVIQHIHIIH